VDSPRLPREIRVEGAKDDACVIRGSVSMQIQKVTAVVRQQNAVFGDSECQDIRIRYGCVRGSGLDPREHIVPQAAEFLNNLQGNVFVGIETDH